MEVDSNPEQKNNEMEQINQNQIEEGMVEQEEDNLEDTEDNKLMYIYEWVDSIPLSRQKKNISRDFNDAVLFAEMIKYHYPRLVDLHNYLSCSSTKLVFTLIPLRMRFLCLAEANCKQHPWIR